MRQVPRSPLSFKLQRVANVPEHPPPSTRLMSCAHIANRRLSRIIGARCSGDLLPPSPPSEKTTARQDQAGKPSTGDGTGNGEGVGERAREAPNGREHVRARLCA